MSPFPKIKNRPSFRIVLGIGMLVILALFVAACGGAAPEPTTEAPPSETEQAAEVTQPTDIPPTPEPELVVDMDQVVDVLWVLLGYGDAANPTVIERNTLISIVFSADGQVSGSAGCNNFTSTYQVDADGTLTIPTPFELTMMCCESRAEE